MNTTLKEMLQSTYYDAAKPGSYGGASALTRQTGLSPKAVKKWLSHQDTYTLHKPVRHHFPRRRTIVGGIDHQWQADLIDVQKLKRANNGYRYLLTVIDIFSKFAWVIPLKDKKGTTLIKAFKDIFKNRKPQKLQSDKGREFLNGAFQSFLQRHGVHLFVTQNDDIKASVVERFNRTLKEKMWRYFTKTNTLKYVKVLPSLLKSYNRSYHRSIKRAPKEVTINNQEDVWQTLYGDTKIPPTPRRPLEIGDRVRISKARSKFRKGYLPSWTEELFTVSRILQTLPITYVLKDDNGRELQGTFYKEEIQRVADKQVYRIESILRQRAGMYLVRWYGYDSSFDSWIPKSALTKYTEDE